MLRLEVHQAIAVRAAFLDLVIETVKNAAAAVVVRAESVDVVVHDLAHIPHSHVRFHQAKSVCTFQIWMSLFAELTLRMYLENMDELLTAGWPAILRSMVLLYLIEMRMPNVH